MSLIALAIGSRDKVKSPKKNSPLNLWSYTHMLLIEQHFDQGMALKITVLGANLDGKWCDCR